MEMLRNADPAEALAALLALVTPVGTEMVSSPAPSSLAGRVLGGAVALDRDSPACDVSAMDGFAVRLAELQRGRLPISGECRIGVEPPTLPAGAALRIYTGSPTPAEADAVVPLERVDESGGQIVLHEAASMALGANIRRRGENARVGTRAIEAGTVVTPATITALATIGAARVAVHRPLRIAIITTGDEVETAPTLGEHPELSPWRLRDSNGPSLEALLFPAPWIGSVDRKHIADSRDDLANAVVDAIAAADALVLTGGVSKGVYDHVPDAVRDAGAQPVFHRIAARPGRPTFAAVLDGKPILGLPGNPVAVLTTGGRLLVPALRRRAGFACAAPPAARVCLDAWHGKVLPLTWWRPVTIAAPGVACLAQLRGSGDTIGGATTDGFIEAPPGASDSGPYAFYRWTI